MSSTGRAVLRFLITPLTAAVVTLALVGVLLAGVVMAAGNVITCLMRRALWAPSTH